MKSELKISPSSFLTFERCSKQFKWHYIDDIPFEKGADNIYAVFGTSFHRAIELHEKHNLTCNELVQSWKVLFLHFFSEAKFLLEKDIRLKDYYISAGESYLVNAFEMMKRWSNYQKVTTEKYVKIAFKNDILKKVFLTGRIDFILKNLESYVCLDWKTGKYKEDDIDNNEQLTFYIYFISTLFNVPISEIYGALAYPIDKDIIFTQRTEEDVSKLFVRINKMIERVVNEDFVKEPIVKFLPDDCGFCPYRMRCQDVN